VQLLEDIRGADAALNRFKHDVAELDDDDNWAELAELEDDEGDVLPSLPVLPRPVAAPSSPRCLRQTVPDTRAAGLSDNTTLRVRSMAGQVLLETQLGSWHILTLPLKYFICGRLHLKHTEVDLIFRDQLLGLDDKLSKLMHAVPDNGIDLLLVRRCQEKEDFDGEDAFLDGFEDNLLEKIGHPPLIWHGVRTSRKSGLAAAMPNPAVFPQRHGRNDF